MIVAVWPIDFYLINPQLDAVSNFWRFLAQSGILKHIISQNSISLLRRVKLNLWRIDAIWLQRWLEWVTDEILFIAQTITKLYWIRVKLCLV